MGRLRDLKKANEAYWSGKLSQEDLLAEAKRLRVAHWKIQKDAGVDIIPSNDFSFYDHILDMIATVGAAPQRYTSQNLAPLDEYFAMGRGHQADGVDVPSLEMVKWFDSNYHYVKPTLSDNQTFKLDSEPKVVREYLEAKNELGLETRPVIIGPVSFLVLGKAERGSTVEPISLIEKLVPVYVELLNKLKDAGAKTIQIDEPVLVLDLDSKVKAAFKSAYEAISAVGLDVTLATYFGDAVHNFDIFPAFSGLKSIHVDLARHPEQLDAVIENLSSNQILSMGVVDGRNIWKNNFAKSLELIQHAVKSLGQDRVVVATSSSLLHVPHTLASEKKLPEDVVPWFSFATEKCDEVRILSKAASDGLASVQSELDANAAAMKSRAESSRTNDPAVKERLSKVTPEMHNRKSPFEVRYAAQKRNLDLPLFPTTTIGSFPQTPDIRITRNKFTKGEITKEKYDEFIRDEIRKCVEIQEEIGLDVLVHGEPERNDMVQYFGEKLTGYVFTTNAWVQSYGSRCVRPPIIVGDVSRPAPMTIAESKYAASVSKKPMKAMTTGPLTVLRWSFPRDDIHQSVQCQQIALAFRDEVQDLEKAGLYIIQVDEPALREGLPLREGAERDAYIKWAVNSFRLATAGVEDSTNITSHFCYSEFQDFFHAIAALDADCLSIENSKSDAKLLQVFIDEAYPRHIGPGVYDIHSPRVPPLEEFIQRISEMLQYLRPEQLWINPDCGLKTRTWDEVKPALKNMVAAAKHFREQYKNKA